jgi:hypothetical protein
MSPLWWLLYLTVVGWMILSAANGVIAFVWHGEHAWSAVEIGTVVWGGFCGVILLFMGLALIWRLLRR